MRRLKLLKSIMKEDITIELAEIKRVIKEYYKQLYAHKSYNLK